MSRSSRRRRRWLVVIGLAVLLLLGTGFTILRVKFEGPDLGDKLASILNKRMRGRIEIGSIEWPSSALKKVVTGGWVPLTLRDVKVWDDCALSAGSTGADPDELRIEDPNQDCTVDDRPDPDPKSKRKPRRLLLAAPLLTTEIDIHAALFGNHDLVFRNLWIRGGEALIEQTNEPYPLHAYNRTIVSIVTAFYPRMKAGFRAGIYADSAPPIFDLRDIHVKDMNLTVHTGPYSNDDGTVGFSMAARIVGVDIDAGPKPANDAYLYMDPTDPLVTKFYVRLGMHGKHGSLRILDDGPRAAFHIPGSQGIGDAWGKGREAKYEVELSEISINRLAQLPTEWPRKDYVANTLEIDGVARTIPCKSDTGPSSPQDGSDLHFTGEILNYWDRPYDGQWNFGLDVKNFGPTLRTCIKPTMGGDNLGGSIKILGPFVALPKVVLDLHGLDFDVPLSATEEPVRLTLAEIHGEIDLVNETGYIDKTKALVRGGKEPGEVMVAATFGLKPVILHADIDITKPIDVGRFLPVKVASAVGNFLAGKLTINGDIDFGFELKDFDLGLGTQHERALRLYSGRIFTKNVFDTIDIEKVKFEAGKSRAMIDGGIEYTNDHYEYKNLKIEGDYQDLDVWLRRFGMPAIIKSAGGGTIILNGPITAPTINAQTLLAGIPCIDTLRIVNSRLKDGILDIEVSTSGLGGSLTGKARLKLDPSGPPYIDYLDINGSRVEAGKFCGLKGIAKGTVDTANVKIAKVSVGKNRSPMDWLSYAQITANAKNLTLFGDAYSDFALCVNRKDDAQCRPDLQRARLDADDLAQCELAKAGGFCAVATASRDLGGQLDATVANLAAQKSTRGHAATPAALGGTIALDNLPLAVVDQVVGANTLGGLISAAFHLSGKLDAPQAEGNIDLLRSWALGAFIGDIHPQVDPIMIGKVPGIQIRGSGMSGNLEISAMVGTQAPFPVRLEVKTHRLELDSVIDLSKKLGLPEPVQAWMTGVVTVTTELAPLDGKPAQPDGWVEIQELEAVIDHRTKEGRLMPIKFALVPPTERGKNAMSLHVTPQAIELACRNASAPTGREPCAAHLETPAGIVSLEGNASQSQMALGAHGTLDLKRLAPLLENQLEAIGGTVDLDAQITGTLDKPHYEVALGEFKNLSVRPIGGDTELQIQTGQIKLANGNLGFNNVTLNVKDEHRDEQGKIVVRGAIALDGLTPAKWGVLIGGPEAEPGKEAEPGTIAGKMLLAVAPGVISQASGLARIDGEITLSGTGTLPLINGTLTFDPPAGQKLKSPFAVIPRGLRRELSMLGGTIEISTRALGNHRTYTLDVDQNPITISIDGEGKLQNIRGNVVLTDGVPERASIELDAESIPFRKPGTLDLIISAKGVTLELPSAKAAWIASGNVTIVGGKYQRNFELTEVLKPAPVSTAPAKPFWDEYPSIGNAQLGLTLDIGKFSVENNIANIDMAGSRIFITGSPRDPRLSGGIRVQRGEFRIPGTRAKFTRTTGSIDFSEIDAASNPRLDVTSEAPDYLDLSGQQHTITLTISGTLEQPQWDLKTSTGFNKSQTLALLLLGRSPEQLRRSLGDQSLGGNPIITDPTTNPSTGFADQIVKDLAGDWVSSLLGGPLTKLVPLDVLRFELGFGSVAIRAEKKAFENIRVLADGEQTIRGQTLNVRVEFRTPWHPHRHLPWITNDRFSLQGAYLDKNFYDPAEQDISDAQGKVVYRLFIP